MSASQCGASIRSSRISRGLSQSALARMTGISRQALSAIEAGAYQPSVSVALRLAHGLGRSVESLFGETGHVSITASVRVLNEPRVNTGTPVVLGRVGGRLIAVPRPLAEVSLEPADGVVEKVSRSDSVRVSVLRSTDEIEGTLLLAGCDPAATVLGSWLRRRNPRVAVAGISCSSRRALAALVGGEVHASGIHLRDPLSGEYNLAAVREGLGHQARIVVNFARWELGLACARGNPLAIRGVSDLAGGHIRIVNREAGSGARLALDEFLVENGIGSAKIGGYDVEATGHLEVAAAIARGHCDAGITLRVAAEAFGLHFIILREERYDLVISEREVDSTPVAALMEALTAASFANELRVLCHYDTASTGDVIARLN